MFSYRNTNIAVLLLAACFLFWHAPLWAWGLLFVLYLSILALGSFAIDINFYFPSVLTAANSQNKIALTFDDGPSPHTLEVLKVLAKWNAKATFFCIGSHIEKHPDILQAIHQQGHLIGNHSYSHKHTFPIFSPKKMREDIAKTSSLISDLLHSKPLFFRPPFGVTNPRIAGAVKKLGLISIGWNKRSLDTVSQDTETVLLRIAKDLAAGDIILLHDNLAQTAVIVDLFLSLATEKGLQSERLDVILNLKGNETI